MAMFMIPPFLRPIALGLVSGVMAVLTVVFLTQESDDAAASNQPFRAQPSTVTSNVARPNIDALVSEILARPLFSPSRRPADEAADQVADAPKEPLKMPGRLEGVTIRPQVREALFEREGQKPIAVKEGQEIEGWTVASIRADSVLLKSAEGEQIVKPANSVGLKTTQIQALNKKPARAKPNPSVGAAAGSVSPPVLPARAAARTGR
jgi:hypothetical protein